MSVNSKSISCSLLGRNGKRKYLTIRESDAFIAAAHLYPNDILLFCEVMVATGCRVSEALSLTTSSFDFDSGIVVIECLKKRKKGVFREIPLPPNLLASIQNKIGESEISTNGRLWSWSRMTAYRNICAVMKSAGVVGDHATPKGLRHGFAVGAIQAGVPLNLVQRWLGHADMSTTAIYASAFGPEERSIAARMWRRRTDFGRAAGRSRDSSPLVGTAEGLLNLAQSHEPNAKAGMAPEATPPNDTVCQYAGYEGEESCPVIQFWLFGNPSGGFDAPVDGGRIMDTGNSSRSWARGDRPHEASRLPSPEFGSVLTLAPSLLARELHIAIRIDNFAAISRQFGERHAEKVKAAVCDALQALGGHSEIGRTVVLPDKDGLISAIFASDHADCHVLVHAACVLIAMTPVAVGRAAVVPILSFGVAASNIDTACEGRDTALLVERRAKLTPISG